MSWGQRLGELHEKMDQFAEAEAANATNVVWLKWVVRGLVAAAIGVGGVIFLAGF